jgi:3-phosphoshikimate 1-carboxyvinyltransferase
MRQLIVRPSGPLRGSIAVPGDKSITHRALLLSALAAGDTRVRGWLDAEDCLATLRCVRALGVIVDQLDTGELLVHGRGRIGLREPADVLHCGGSGTTMRLLSGLLAGQPFTSVMTGSEALRRRPMARVAEPLREMGATVLGRDGGRLPPLAIQGGQLHGIDYPMPVASAQVKSALLLAGLYADGEMIVHEPGPARDHTERMLRLFGATVENQTGQVWLPGKQGVYTPGVVEVPADFSSAAFPLAGALIVAGSEVEVRRVGINPTRTGLYDLLVAMGGDLHLTPLPDASGNDLPADAGEPLADVTARAAVLRATEVAGDVVVCAIDELPMFAIVATQAEGTTVIRDATELRVKETDRIGALAQEMRHMGAQVEERPDGMLIHGPTQLVGATVEAHHDHRLAMSLAVAALAARGETTILGADAIDDSFPEFVDTMRALGANMQWVEAGGPLA